MIQKVTHQTLDLLHLQISGLSFDKNKCLLSLKEPRIVLGIVNERVSQGTKTNLRKILAEIAKHLSIWEESKTKDLSEGEEMLDEEFDFEFEPIKYSDSKIEDIISDCDYTITIDLLFI